MKLRSTLILTCLTCFFLVNSYQKGNAQNLYKQSFDTSANVSSSSTPWGLSAGNSIGYSCCLPSSTSYLWFYGPPIGSPTSCPYYVTGSIVGSYDYAYPLNAPHTGSGQATFPANYIYTYGSTDLAYFTTPSISLPSTGKATVSYWVYRDPSAYYSCYGGWLGSSYQDSLTVYANNVVGISSGSPYRLRNILIDSYYTVSSGWYQFVDTIPSSFYGSGVYLNFVGYGAYYGYYSSDISVDDISIDHYYQCSGTPYAGYLNGPSHICATKSFSLIDTNLVKYIGFTYQWQYRITGSGSAWSNIGSPTTSNPITTSLFATGNATTDFRVYATCNASGVTDTSFPFTVIKDTFYKCYCALPTTNTNLGGGTPPLIDSVAISGTTLKHPSHTAITGSFIQYPDTGNATGTVTRGGTYTMYVKYAPTLSAYGMAWIDWNRSGLYGDSSGEFYTVNSSLGYGGTVTFTVPSTARLGKTGFRVRNSSNYAASSSYPCTNFGTGSGAGETEEFILNVQDTPFVDLGVTAITVPPAGVTYCAAKADSLTATVFNFGKTAQTGFFVYGNIIGPATYTISTKYTGTLAPLTSVSLFIGTFVPELGGNYTVKVFTALKDSNSVNDTLYSSVNINPLPGLPLTLNDTECTGAAKSVISVTPVGTGKYKWYSAPVGGTPVFTGTSITFTSPTRDTVLYVSAIDSNSGCETNRVPITSAVRPGPVVALGPNATMCESPTFALDAGNPGARYLWSTTDTTETIHVTTSGTYSVTASRYHCSASGSVTLTINPLPKATGISYVRAGTTYSFNVTDPTNVTSYKWYFDFKNPKTSDTSVSASPVYTYAVSGAYQVAVLLTNACGTDTVIWGIPTGIASVNQQSNPITLSPNPASSVVRVSTEKLTMSDVTIINGVGATVYRGNFESQKTGEVNINQLPAGVYIIRINTTGGYYSKLFQVMH